MIVVSSSEYGAEKADIDISQIYTNVRESFSSKTMEHVQQMFNRFKKQNVFGRSDVQMITGLGSSRASVLLKMLVDANIIEPVSGHGKGKYQFR